MVIFETHAHYDDPQFKDDQDEVIQACHEAGIAYICNIADSFQTCKSTLALARKYPFVFAAIGIHPHEAKTLNEDNFLSLYDYLTADEEKVVAVGEIGLDYHYDYSPRDVQQDWFIEQIELAKELELPIVIHTREAMEDTYNILKEYKAGMYGGVIHSYSGSVEMAREFIKLGFHIGIGGMVTFKNAKRVVETVEKIPLSSIVVETDSPYLAPVPNRGRRNDSRNLPYIIERIAEIRGIDPEEAAEAAFRNAQDLYHLEVDG